MNRLLLICIVSLVYSSVHAQHLKEYNLYGQIGINRYRNTGTASFDLRAPTFAVGINRILLEGKFDGELFYITTGMEYGYINNYVNLHYNNGVLEKPVQGNIHVKNLSHHQLQIPVIFSHGIRSKDGNNLLRISAGFYAAYLFGLREDYTDSLTDKQLTVSDGYNKVNFGFEVSIGLDKLYKDKVKFAPLSGALVGTRYSFMGIGKVGNLYIPIEFFVRINVW